MGISSLPEAVLSQLQVLPYSPYLIISFTLWFTYLYIVLRGGFVSDDLAGIEGYDGTLMYPVDTKELVAKEVQKVRKVSYGTLSKWVRYHICGGHFPSRHHYPANNGVEGTPIPSGKVASHHHILSIVCANIAAILLYNFLLSITTPFVALLTVILFVIHPTCVQAVAWPSAIGYILSLICICSTINIASWATAQTELAPIILGVGGVAFFSIWGVFAQAIPMFTWIILLVLGQWQMALVSGFFSLATASFNLRGYVVHRKEEFKKQAMDDSTSFNIRKPIVALKTFAYYIYLALFPIRLGLYHGWGFHYDKKMELWDWRAISGLVISVGLFFVYMSSGLPIRIGIVWFAIFLFLFLNWITAQQWVTERYLYIPVIGVCLIASVFLQHSLCLYFLVAGMLLCRTMTHLPTYDNELRFYLSNTWNFPKSEVAYGNLGVAYASVGLLGASNDMWVIGSSLNKEYDVPFYNMFSRMKTNAFLMIQNGAYEQGLAGLNASIPMLEKVLACKVLHFKDMWQKELVELKNIVQNPAAFLMGEMQRLEQVKWTLTTELTKTTDPKRQNELIPSINDNFRQMENLKAFLASKGIIIEYNPEKGLLSKLTQGGPR